MIIKGKFLYKKAIVLTEARMRELHEVLSGFFDKITYAIETAAKSDIEFADVDELLSYDNYSKRSIKSVLIRCTKSKLFESTVLTIDAPFAFFTQYCETVRCTYAVTNIDEEERLKSQIITVFDKAKAGHWFVGKFCATQLFLLLGAYSFIYILLNMQDSTPSSLSTAGYIVFTTSYVGIWYISTYLLGKLWDRIFPAIAYCWGERVNENKRGSSLRSQILWGTGFAIVGGFIGLILTKLFQ